MENFLMCQMLVYFLLILSKENEILPAFGGPGLGRSPEDSTQHFIK
jgi:hypothetical protein